MEAALLLILTCRIGETLIICDDTRVNVLGVKGNHIRLGIDGSQGTNVARTTKLLDREEEAGW